MKRSLSKKMFLCCSVAMLTLFGLYGCSNQKGTDSRSTNVGDTNAGNAKSGNTSAANGKSGNRNKKFEQEVQREYIIEDISGLKRFELDHEVGNITMGFSNDEKIHVNAKSYVTAYTQENLDKIINSMDIVKNVVDDNCILNVVNKSGGMELWDWMDQEVKQYNVSMDLEVLIPHNFEAYDISVDTGTICIAGLEGHMDLETDNGAIKLVLNENLSKNLSAELETDNGNIEINLNANPIQYTQNENNHMKAVVNNICVLEATAENGLIDVIQ